MANIGRALGGLVADVAGKTTRELGEKSLSASGRRFSKEAIDTIISSKGVSVLGENAKFAQKGMEIPTKDLQAVKYLAESGDTRFADYQEAYDGGITPVMINIADKVNQEILERSQKADVLKQVDELKGLRTEGERKLKTRGGQDPGSSTLSTGPELISGDKRIYQLNTKLREPYKEYEDLLISDPVAKKFHHKFMKGQSVPYFERAWELVDAGLASEEDIIALHRYALDAGVGTGDRQSAIMMFERIPHEELHNFMLDIGIQPSATKFAKESVSASGRKTRVQPSANSPLKRDVKRIKKIETIEDLAADFQQAVDEIAVPMTKEAELLQEAWQAIDIQVRDALMDNWNKRNMARRVGNKEAAERFNKEYKRLKKEAIEQMKTNRAKYGEELDEFGNPDPESYGRAEIKQDLAVEKQLRGIQ